MNRRYLILDCDYLAHRAKYVFGDLSHKGNATGVVYGFLKDILNMTEQFDTQRIIFCWDSKRKKRKEIYPQYKANRIQLQQTLKEEEFEKAFYYQIELLRTEYLKTIGFKNILQQTGYEADDLIAEVCRSLNSDSEEAVMITADQDMFQLIRSNIIWYNPRSKLILNVRKFKKKFGIRPKQWAKVKAIAGCHSDSISGVMGVGEKTAIKYIRGELKRTSKAYKAIKEHWEDIVLRNRILVQLPMKGMKPVRIEQDNISQTGWNKVTKKLGMRSIRYRTIEKV